MAVSLVRRRGEIVRLEHPENGTLDLTLVEINKQGNYVRLSVAQDSVSKDYHELGGLIVLENDGESITPLIPDVDICLSSLRSGNVAILAVKAPIDYHIPWPKQVKQRPLGGSSAPGVSMYLDDRLF